MLYLLSALPEKRRKPTELPTEIIMSLLLSVYTDRQYPSEIRSVYTDKICSSVYTNRIADGLYSFFEKLQRCDEVDFFFQTVLPTEWPRDSNRDLRTVTRHSHRRVYRRNVSVGESIGKSQYIPTLPTLSSSISPSSSPSQLSPPKLQPTTHPNSPPLLNTSTQVSYTFIRGHNIRSPSNLLWILSFFVSNLSFLVLTFKCQFYYFLLFF
jgi:hypothetical protein